MNYHTGHPVRVGDFVRIEFGKTDGQVTEVIESVEGMKNWNVEEAGLMIRSEPFGLVFWPKDHSDPVHFVRRANDS